jgi:5-hydroxyisourate hydrolase
MDQKLSLSTHILDTTKGKPAENVPVILYKLIDGDWIKSNLDGKTDKDGRVKDFSKVDQEIGGVYKLKFEVTEYFQRIETETLYPFVEVSLLNLASIMQYLFWS